VLVLEEVKQEEGDGTASEMIPPAKDDDGDEPLEFDVAEDFKRGAKRANQKKKDAASEANDVVLLVQTVELQPWQLFTNDFMCRKNSDDTRFGYVEYTDSTYIIRSLVITLTVKSPPLVKALLGLDPQQYVFVHYSTKETFAKRTGVKFRITVDECVKNHGISGRTRGGTVLLSYKDSERAGYDFDNIPVGTVVCFLIEDWNFNS
jgi:hypothetical protein